MKTGLTFSKDDLQKHKELDESISRLAKWSGNTAEIAQLYRGLVWFAQLRPKIEANIIEVKAVHEYKKPDAEPEKAE